MNIKQGEALVARREFLFTATNVADDTGYSGALSGSDIKVRKAGGSVANSAGTATKITDGLFVYAPTVDEIDTLGIFTLYPAKAGLYNDAREVCIVPWDPFDVNAMGMARLDAPVSSCSPTNMANVLLDLADSIETGLTLRQALRGFAAVIAGLTTGAGTGTEVFRAMKSNSKPRVTTTMTGANRTGITLDLD